MQHRAPPRIFSSNRRNALRRRMAHLQMRANAPAYLIDDMVDDTIERLAFLRHEPQRALIIGDTSGRFGAELRTQGADVTERDPVLGDNPLDEEMPYDEALSEGGFDLVVSLAVLDTVNDLPGALIHIRKSLARGGLAICSFVGAGSLPMLRQIMLAADGDYPAARLHPLVDAQAGAHLLQRAGFTDPVTDSHSMTVRYSSLQSITSDLRAMGQSSVLADRPPQLTKTALARAKAKFAELADDDRKLVENFELLTLTGRKL